MTPTRSSVPPAALQGSGRHCGQRQEIFATSGHCRETGQARLRRSTMLATWLGTRKVHEACARFCGLQQLECRTWGCSRVDTPAELSVSMTRVLWLGVRQARREIALSFGTERQG